MEIMDTVVDGAMFIFNAIPICNLILDENFLQICIWGYYWGLHEFRRSELLGAVCAFIFVLHDTA